MQQTFVQLIVAEPRHDMREIDAAALERIEIADAGDGRVDHRFWRDAGQPRCAIDAVGDEYDAVHGARLAHFGGDVLVRNTPLHIEFEHRLAIGPIQRLAQSRRCAFQHIAVVVAQTQRLELRQRQR